MSSRRRVTSRAMLDQPFQGSSFIGKQLGWNPWTSDAQINVSHHAPEGTAVDKQRERHEAVDERLAGVMMARLRIERLGGADVHEKRATPAAGRCNGDGQICLGIIERLICTVADSHDDKTIPAQLDDCRLS